MHTFVLILVVILILSLRIFIDYKSSKIKGIKYVKTKIKEVIIFILCLIIIFTVYNYLPKYETEIDIYIKNNNKVAEIYINGDIYNLYENEKIININNIKKTSGIIAIKTGKANKLIFYENKETIFPNNRRININLKNENIEINSFFIGLAVFGENINFNYDSFLEILMKKK